MVSKIALTVLVTLVLTGCGIDWDRAARASMAGMDGVNQYYMAHPPLQLPPSQCYVCYGRY